MSYLAPLRVHFSGRYQAAPSTINNLGANYDVARFRKEFQQPGHPRAQWNPRGSAEFRLVGCRVRSAFRADGTPAAADDPVLELVVADSDRLAPAKLVDLDPDQQLASVIWGLEVRIADDAGRSRMVGRFAPASFTDLWERARGSGPGGDFRAAACFQSVLTDLEWDDVEDSEVLAQLKARAETSGRLSLKFNVDGYTMDSTSPNFTRGRVVGTIGVAEPGEPRHFVVGRQLTAVRAPVQSIFSPLGRINFCPAVVHEADRLIMIDLGNALPTRSPGGPLQNNGTLSVGVQTHGSPTTLGTVDYLADGWYENFAGVVALRLSDAQLAAVHSAPLTLSLSSVDQVTSEATDGRYVRADALAHRLDPGDTLQLDVWASVFGRPASLADIETADDPSGFQGDQGNDPLAVSYPARLPPTDANGRTALTISASDPGNPRGFIDGQLYGVRTRFAGTPATAVANPWVFASLLVSDEFTPSDPVTWHTDIAPILQQFANLYPVMNLFLDLSDYESVCANRELLLLAFGLDVTDPNSMPVTRDLSRTKRTAILRWLSTLGADGKPLLGSPPPERGHPEPQPAPTDEPVSKPSGLSEGKTTAAARRISVRSTAERGGAS